MGTAETIERAIREIETAAYWADDAVIEGHLRKALELLRLSQVCQEDERLALIAAAD